MTAARGVFLAAVVVASTTLSGPVSASAADADRCNGSTRLCAVALGDVAFATTHNSMASSADGFVPPNQDEPIDAQLVHGIRGFQLDVYAGYPRTGGVYTDIEGRFGTQVTDLPPRFVDLALRIHRRLGAPPAGTPTRVYLCHTFCELGAVRMSTVMREIRTFLDAHPREVLVMVLEDYVPPARIRAVLDGAGLGSMLLPFAPGDTLPTLGDMIESGKRLLVSLENGDGGTMLPNAFGGLVEETPFNFLRASDLRAPRSCDRNRGVPGSPVFQFNHWVTPARRAGVGRVNGELLRTRAARCREVRGRALTLVAVDFAEHGNVLGVVRDLNRGAS